MTHSTVPSTAAQAVFTAVVQLPATGDLPMATVAMDASTQHQVPPECLAVADSATALPTLPHPLLTAEPLPDPFFVVDQNIPTKSPEATALAAPTAGLPLQSTDASLATLARMANSARTARAPPQEAMVCTVLAMAMIATAMVDQGTPRWWRRKITSRLLL